MTVSNHTARIDRAYKDAADSIATAAILAVYSLAGRNPNKDLDALCDKVLSEPGALQKSWAQKRKHPRQNGRKISLKLSAPAR